MSALATCKVVAMVTNPLKALDDASRLGLDLNQQNNYQGSFDGTILAFSGQIHAYVINDSAKTLHLVKLNELTNVEPIL